MGGGGGDSHDSACHSCGLSNECRDGAIRLRGFLPTRVCFAMVNDDTQLLLSIVMMTLCGATSNRYTYSRAGCPSIFSSLDIRPGYSRVSRIQRALLYGSPSSARECFRSSGRTHTQQNNMEVRLSLYI